MPIYNLNKTNHKKIVSNIIPFNKTVIYYYSKECPYCLMLEGLWKDIKKKYHNTDKIIIYIERDNMKKYLESKYHINLVPCIQYYDKGKKKIGIYEKKRI